jgi:hypothetical protein
MQKWPISKYKKTTGWIFVKETKSCTYESALKQAYLLQKNDKGFSYRIWDQGQPDGIGKDRKKVKTGN